MHFYIDIEKALNRSKLVQRPVTVHKQDGSTHTRRQWVRATKDEPKQQNAPAQQEQPKPSKPKGEPQLYVKPASAPKPKPSTPTPHKDEGLDRARELLHRLQESKKDVTINPEPFKMYRAPLSIKHTDHGLPDRELALRMGEVGPLDLNELTKGTRPDSREGFKHDFARSSRLMDAYVKTAGKGIDPVMHFRSIFKSTTVEGLNHVFSAPNSGVFARLSTIDVSPRKHDYVATTLNFALYDAKTRKSIGAVGRTFHRDANGEIHTHFDLLEITEGHEGKGIGSEMYERMDQFLRYLSGGHPIHCTIEANISVGIYAWAKKGYDFATAGYLKMARDQFWDFCSKNGMSPKQKLRECGYERLEDLQHAWQFAALDDGVTYSMKRREAYPDIKGTGNFGKYFMLGGMSSWEGKKTLNTGSDGEKISGLHNR